MAEYSRLASGQVTSTGGATAVVLPFIPDFIEISNQTRAAATSGITRAWWETDMGQGAAFKSTYGSGDGYITAATGTGFQTISAGIALQFGPNVLLGSSGGITRVAGAPVITTTSVHGLVIGDVVVFNNLYMTDTTHGMQQMAGVWFQVVTVPTTTSFTVNWDNSGSNYTTITAGGLNTLAGYKQVLYPNLYAPSVAVISAITTGTTTTIQTTFPTNVKVGQEVAFRIPTPWGTTQLNELGSPLNQQIPGFPVYGYVVSVADSTNFVVNINSTSYTAYNANQPFLSFPGLKYPQVIPAGDVNTGGKLISSGSLLYPSPTLYNGYQGSVTAEVSTINGPGIQGAFINATWMGFIIGSGVSGTAADVLFYRAYLHDRNV
jgi:hypothetical protein